MKKLIILSTMSIMGIFLFGRAQADSQINLSPGTAVILQPLQQVSVTCGLNQGPVNYCECVPSFQGDDTYVIAHYGTKVDQVYYGNLARCEARMKLIPLCYNPRQ